MKPKGSASRKNARSSSRSVGPAQPKIAASMSGSHEKAVDVASLELATGPLGGGAIGDRPGLETVEDAARAQIDAHRAEAKAAEHVAVQTLQPFPLLLRRLGRAHGADLK